MDKGRTQSNGQEDKTVDEDAQDYIHKMRETKYMSRKKGGRGLAGIEECGDGSIRRLEYFIKMCIITVASNSTDNRFTKTKKKKLEEK